jgi:hypothetical protein
MKLGFYVDRIEITSGFSQILVSIEIKEQDLRDLIVAGQEELEYLEEQNTSYLRILEREASSLEKETYGS